MARIDNKLLFFTTSPRTPAKMIPEIRLLSERFSGKPWNKLTQEEFIDELAQSDFLKEKDRRLIRLLVLEIVSIEHQRL